MNPEIGRVAYEAFREMLGRPRHLLPWEDLKPSEREIWTTYAALVVKAADDLRERLLRN